VPAQLSIGDALVLRRVHADCDRTPIPPRGTAKRRPLMPANPEPCLPKCCFAREAARLASAGRTAAFHAKQHLRSGRRMSAALRGGLSHEPPASPLDRF
jgi:hypothetical protein